MSFRQFFNNLFNSEEEKPENPPINGTEDILDLGPPNALNELEQFSNQAATLLYDGINTAYNWASNHLSWAFGELNRTTLAGDGIVDTIYNAIMGTHPQIHTHRNNSPHYQVTMVSFSMPFSKLTRFEEEKIIEIIQAQIKNSIFHPEAISQVVCQFMSLARPSIHNNFRNIPYTQFEALCYEHCAAIFLEACKNEPETVKQLYHNLFADMDLGMATDVTSNASSLVKELSEIFNSNNTSIVPLGFFKPAHLATQEILQQAQQQHSQTRLKH